jgi:hypothetical protein
LYGSLLLELSERHPSLPEFANANSTIVRESQLPDAFVKEMATAARKRPGVMRKSQEKRNEGKWPEFALAVLDDAQKLGVSTTKFALGPSKPFEFKPEVNEFVTGTLKNRIRPEEWRSVQKQEGHWPEYPKRVMALAREHDLEVPGVSLPGRPSQWDRYYRQRGPGKGS